MIEKSSLRRFDAPAAVGGASTAAAPTGQAVPQYGIQYHGGPVMSAGMNIYIIWYGTHSATTKANLKTFVSNIRNTSYWNINNTYTNAAGTALWGTVTFMKAVADSGTGNEPERCRDPYDCFEPPGSCIDERWIFAARSEWHLSCAHGYKRDGLERFLHEVLSLAHALHEQRRGHQVLFRRLRFALPELWRGAESWAEWRPEHGWYGFDHRSRDGRSAD